MIKFLINLFKKQQAIEYDFSSYTFIRESTEINRVSKIRWLDILATDEQKSIARSFSDLESLVLGKVTLEEFKKNEENRLQGLQVQAFESLAAKWGRQNLAAMSGQGLCGAVNSMTYNREEMRLLYQQQLECQALEYPNRLRARAQGQGAAGNLLGNLLGNIQ